MLSSVFVVALSLASSVLALPSLHNVTRACGTTITAEQIVAAEAHFAQHKVQPAAVAAVSPNAGTISVYFHVVYKSTST